MTRVLGSVVALGLIVLVAFPFALDAYHRWEVARQLGPVMDERDQAALRQWNGSPTSFARAFCARYEQSNGRSVPACEPYKSSIQ